MPDMPGLSPANGFGSGSDALVFAKNARTSSPLAGIMRAPELCCATLASPVYRSAARSNNGNVSFQKQRLSQHVHLAPRG